MHSKDEHVRPPQSLLAAAACLCAAVTAIAAAAPAPSDAEAVAEVWRQLAETQTVAARQALRHVSEHEARAKELASAVVKMAQQPVSDENLREAESSLLVVMQGSDDLAALAGYLQARLYQEHYSTHNETRALELYRALAAKLPQSHWARLGLVKTGILSLYLLPEPADSVARLHGVEALLPAIAEPPLQRDLNLQLAWASILFRRPPEETLVYLRGVDEVGGLSPLAMEDVVTQLAELSLRVGRLEDSRRYYRRVLEEFPTTGRVYDIHQKLIEIDERLQRASAAKGAKE